VVLWFDRSRGYLRRRPHADIVSLTPKDGIRYALGRSLWGRWRLKLTPRGRGNGTFCRTIGDAIERVGNARQFKCKLVDPARSLQYDNSFSAEVKSDPEHQPNHEGYTRHENVMTCDRDASARDGNHVVREQGFLPAGVLDCLKVASASRFKWRPPPT